MLARPAELCVVFDPLAGIEVAERTRAADAQRLEVATQSGWRFSVDVPSGQTPPVRVRIGFDSAHVRSV